MLVFWLALPLAAGFAPPARGRRLAVSRRPAFDHLISAEGAVEAPCGCARPDAGFNLTQYMRLPTEQYTVVPMPLGASLLRLDAASFELRPLPMSLLEGTPVEVRVEPRAPLSRRALASGDLGRRCAREDPHTAQPTGSDG